MQGTCKSYANRMPRKGSRGALPKESRQQLTQLSMQHGIREWGAVLITKVRCAFARLWGARLLQLYVSYGHGG